MFHVDWTDARVSLRQLSALEPGTVMCGHRRPLRAHHMHLALHGLVNEFGTIDVEAP